MTRGEEYKRHGVVFIGKNPKWENFTEPGATLARQRAKVAPELCNLFPIFWVWVL